MKVIYMIFGVLFLTLGVLFKDVIGVVLGCYALLQAKLIEIGEKK